MTDRPDDLAAALEDFARARRAHADGFARLQRIADGVRAEPPPAETLETSNEIRLAILHCEAALEALRQEVVTERTPEGEPARMTTQEWCNIWKILCSLDLHELIEAGVFDDINVTAWEQNTEDKNWWIRFRNNSPQTFIGCTEDRQAKIWSIVLLRMKP